MARDLLYWRKTVPYTVVLRRHVLDNIGVALNGEHEWTAIEADGLMDFKLANKRMILDGVIVPMDTPTIDWDTPNALTDEQMDDLLKNFLKLRSSLKTLDSTPTLTRLLERAKQQDKSQKVKDAIRERLQEITGDEILSPNEMGGTFN